MQTNGSSNVLKWLVVGVLVISLTGSSFALGFGAGFGTGRWTMPSAGQASIGMAAPEEGASAVPTATVPASTSRPSTNKAQSQLTSDSEEFRVFWEALAALQKDYYGDLPTSQEMTYGAIRGMLDLLGDQNTALMDPQSAEFFSSDISGSFEGIGARVDTAPTGGVLIVEPFEGQPAFAAGVQRDDVVIAVDGKDITEMALSDAIQLIRGPKGTKIKLTIKRPAAPDLIEITVTRDRIDIPVVEAKMLDNDIAYLRLGEFNSRSPELMRQSLSDLLKQNPKGLILDLRGNPGGLLDAAVDIGSQFVGKGNILLERFKDGTDHPYPARGRGLATSVPLAVLVNEGSASASEIVAGAIQDAGRGPLIGATTFGKGSVQVPHRLGDGSLLRVTIAHWFTPKGRGIDGSGLEPDIKVERTLEDRAAESDPQLDRAVEYLLKGE
jgi:carboxyl-terminal processing protease